jgi:hypothetical protein
MAARSSIARFRFPAPAPGEALVAIHAAGTNRGELLARPLLRSSNPSLRPMAPGSSSPAKSQRWAMASPDGASATA